MKRLRFTEEQIIGFPREHKAGMKTADLCRKHGISSTTFFKWKSKFGGMEASDGRKLKKLLADARLALADWMDDYNTVRSHSAIGNLPPMVFAKLSGPGIQRDGSLELLGASAPHPVAPPSLNGSNGERALPSTG
jgi:putative transposase